MVKNITNSGVGSTSQVNQGNLAAQIKDITAYLGELNNQSFSETKHCEDCFNKEFTYSETPIINALEKYLENPAVTLHIPAHGYKEGILPRFRELIGDKAVKADTTDDFDGLGQLYPASGPIKEAQDLAAKAFNTKHTFFLVNGSTIGNLALALATTKPGKKVIMARNCHRSVISGLTMTGALPVWVLPERNDEWGLWGAITPETIEKALIDNPDASVVWITNPTYEGIVSDVKSIAAVCKKYNVPFIVDEAHGCHWTFNKDLPVSGIEAGADAVVHSIHKTGGSFSQSSMLHLNFDSKISYTNVLSSLTMLHSTSPSYLLLASLDAARSYLNSDHGYLRIKYTIECANKTRKLINSIPGCYCLEENDGFVIDPTKLYICMDGINGKQLKNILEEEYNIETEAKTDEGILALANIGNTEFELEYLFEALCNIAKGRKQFEKRQRGLMMKYMPFSIPEMVCSPRDAFFSDKEAVRPEDAVGRISTEIIAVCPPGIPILVPGESVQAEHLHYLKDRENISVIKS